MEFFTHGDTTYEFATIGPSGTDDDLMICRRTIA